MKRFFLFFILAFLIGVLAVRRVKGPDVPKSENVENRKEEAAVVLFYGNGCPHCGEVKEWLESHPKIKEKVNLQEKEVYGDNENARELMARAKECGIAAEGGGIGVPFLYDQGQCLIGDQSIINYLNDSYNQ